MLQKAKKINKTIICKIQLSKKSCIISNDF